MAVASKGREQVREQVGVLESDFGHHPEAVLVAHQKSGQTRTMVRGDAQLHIPQFLVSFSIGAETHRPDSLVVITVNDGLKDYHQAARFATIDRYVSLDQRAGDVLGIDSRRSGADREEAIQSARLLLPAALEAQPLPIDKAVAELIINPN